MAYFGLKFGIIFEKYGGSYALFFYVKKQNHLKRITKQHYAKNPRRRKVDRKKLKYFYKIKQKVCTFFSCRKTEHDQRAIQSIFITRINDRVHALYFFPR